MLVKALMRFAFMVANNLVAIPSCICYVILLQPLLECWTVSASGILRNHVQVAFRNGGFLRMVCRIYSDGEERGY
jgi:hypothetical protein